MEPAGSSRASAQDLGRLYFSTDIGLFQQLLREACDTDKLEHHSEVQKLTNHSPSQRWLQLRRLREEQLQARTQSAIKHFSLTSPIGQIEGTLPQRGASSFILQCLGGCLGLDELTDIYVGKQAQVFESPIQSQADDQECFSLVGSDCTLNLQVLVRLFLLC